MPEELTSHHSSPQLTTTPQQHQEAMTETLPTKPLLVLLSIVVPFSLFRPVSPFSRIDCTVTDKKTHTLSTLWRLRVSICVFACVSCMRVCVRLDAITRDLCACMCKCPFIDQTRTDQDRQETITRLAGCGMPRKQPTSPSTPLLPPPTRTAEGTSPTWQLHPMGFWL